MSKTYAILGAGMQGTAAAYDLAKFADAAAIKMGDRDPAQAHKNAWRVNDLVGAEICRDESVDATSPTSLGDFLEGVDVVLSCLPYWMHPEVAKVAIRHRVNMVDLGGNTEITLHTLALDADAKAAGVALVPDCGLAPGLVNNLGCYLLENLPGVETIRLYCGVLPQNPQPPFNYKVTFNVEGLVTEYDYQAVVLRNGAIHLVDTLTELEDLTLDELGPMEAFVTSGGTSTAPYSFQDRLRNYEYKTIRFPGHCERMRLYKDFGLWREDEVDVPGGRVRPKDVFCKVFGPALAKFVDTDQCAVRAVGTATENGQTRTMQMDIFDRQCPDTGFTSMERLTGFSISIVAQEIAAGRILPGASRYELAMTGTRFVEEIQRRGIQLRIQG